VIAFATLGVLGRLAYPGAGAVRIIVGLSLFGALIEVLQAIPVLHRDSELLDWVADTIAAAAAVLAVAWWRPRRG
jgi:VanZ family protein